MSWSMPKWSYPWELCSEYHYCILLNHHHLKFRRLNENHSSDTHSNCHRLSFQPHLWVSNGTRPCKTTEAASVLMSQVLLRNALFPWCDHDQLPVVPFIWSASLGYERELPYIFPFYSNRQNVNRKLLLCGDKELASSAKWICDFKTGILQTYTSKLKLY